MNRTMPTRGLPRYSDIVELNSYPTTARKAMYGRGSVPCSPSPSINTHAAKFKVGERESPGTRLQRFAGWLRD